MNITILSHGYGLKEILTKELSKIGLQATQVDYKKPLFPQITESEVLINGLGKIDKDMIDNCHKLKPVQQIGAGIDNIDIDYCTNKAILVANTPATNNISVVEHTLFLMLSIAKKIKGAGEGLMKGRAQSVLGSELYGKTLLVIGLGAIGTEVAKRATAFGMRVISVTVQILIFLVIFLNNGFISSRYLVNCRHTFSFSQSLVNILMAAGVITAIL